MICQGSSVSTNFWSASGRQSSSGRHVEGRLIYGNTGTAFNTNTNANINMPQEPFGKRKEGGDLRVFSCFIKCTQISLLATVADSST